MPDKTFAMKKIICAVLLTAILACNQEPKTVIASATSTDAKAMYEKNLAVLQSGITAFEKEDINENFLNKYLDK